MDEKQKKKMLIMQIGAGGLTCLILVLWIFNLKNVWQEDRALPTNDNSQWLSLKNDLDKTLTDVKKQLNKIDKNRKEAAAGDNFLTDLIKETKNISSATSSIVSTSSPISSSSPTTTSTSPINKNKNCPEYINCMPTIDAARPCQIPVGCEGITAIAY